MSPNPTAGGLAALDFDNRFTRELPADPQVGGPRRQVADALFSRVKTRNPKEPRLVAYSREVAELVGLDPATCDGPEFARLFSGGAPLEAMDPFAMRYGGHQFGNWAGQLGDGRAINLGQVKGADARLWMLQLKGAGPTPYSRQGDGLAVLRSSVREFLCSEAMYHLGVPTTRALSLVTTGWDVMRDMFYDGNAKLEPGAVVCRVARSFTRFGHFELCAARGEVELLRTLADHTIRSEFAQLELPPEGTALQPEHYLAWIDEVIRTTLELVVHWERVGFVHGVLNTDNMSILGETIDYGPYGWLEGYEPDWTPNTTDAQGRRYRYAHQADVAHWNLTRLLSALVPLVEDVAPLQERIDRWQADHTEARRAMFAAKLGLQRYEEGDDELFDELIQVLQLVETDMTIAFRQLAAVGRSELDEQRRLAPFQAADYTPDAVTGEVLDRRLAWVGQWQERLTRDGRDDAERAAAMNAVNPRYVLRNYLAQIAIDAAEKGDPTRVQEQLEVLRRPYDDQPGREEFEGKRPEWARSRPGCSMLSCSS